MIKQDFETELAIHELECGAHDDLMCYCTIENKLAELHERLGDKGFERFLLHLRFRFCDACPTGVTPVEPVPPTPIDPTPPNPIPPTIEVVSRSACPAVAESANDLASMERLRTAAL